MARDVSGSWEIQQSNMPDGPRVRFNIQQIGTTIIGGASFGGTSGSGIGQVGDNSFLYTVTWSGGESVGEYTGTFQPNGRLSGFSFDIKNPASQATWVAPDRVFN
jgi:hypothetical protein